MKREREKRERNREIKEARCRAMKGNFFQGGLGRGYTISGEKMQSKDECGIY